MDQRVEKAKSVLEFLESNHPETDVVVFPEYSLPILDVLPVLQDASTRCNFVIIGGADNIEDPTLDAIHTMCPILLPKRNSPLWVTKRRLSQWELGYVDTPKRTSSPILKWVVGRKTFWLATYVCMDLTLAIRDPLPAEDDPVLYVVPMCSPDNTTFWTYADTLLWEEAGRAVLLCNSVGESAAGRSSLFAVTPRGKRLRPALELPNSGEEGIAVFSLDLAHLVLPRRSSRTPRSSVGSSHFYSIRATPMGVEIAPRDVVPQDGERARGVINPAIFEMYGKKLRITFGGAPAYGTLTGAGFAEKGFEVYSVLGHRDMVVSHLHQSAYAMIYDIWDAVPWKLPTGEMMHSQLQLSSRVVKMFPYFEVDTYHKVLGERLSDADQEAFSEVVPSRDELNHLLALSVDWSDARVPDDARVKFRERRWVLGATTRPVDDVNAIMTIYLDHPDEIGKPLQDFNRHVLPKLLDNQAITSIYEGSGTRMQAHYIVRISCDAKDLFSFIEIVHQLATEERLMLNTSTYLIVKKWAALDLQKALLLPELPPGEANYRDTHLLPRLPLHDRTHLLTRSEEDQLKVLNCFRALETAIIDVSQAGCLDGEDPSSVLNELALGFAKRKDLKELANQDVPELRAPHDLLQSKVEKTLKTAAENVEEEFLASVKEDLSIQEWKTIPDLNYTDLVKLSIQAAKDEMPGFAAMKDLQDLYGSTIQVRNAVVHSNWDKISVDAYVQALVCYCGFLQKARQA